LSVTKLFFYNSAIFKNIKTLRVLECLFQINSKTEKEIKPGFFHEVDI